MFFDRGYHRVAFEWEYEVGSHHEFAWLRYAKLTCPACVETPRISKESH